MENKPAIEVLSKTSHVNGQVTPGCTLCGLPGHFKYQCPYSQEIVTNPGRELLDVSCIISQTSGGGEVFNQYLPKGSSILMNETFNDHDGESSRTSSHKSEKRSRSNMTEGDSPSSSSEDEDGRFKRHRSQSLKKDHRDRRKMAAQDLENTVPPQLTPETSSINEENDFEQGQSVPQTLRANSGSPVQNENNFDELSESEMEIERQVVEVTEDMLFRIENEEWNHVNGIRGSDGQFTGWEDIIVETEEPFTDTLVILPYVNMTW